MSYLGYFSISFEKIMFSTKILTQKIKLLIFFFTRFTHEKHTPQNNFSLKNSVEKWLVFLTNEEIVIKIK